MRHFCAQADPKAHATRLRRRGLPVPGAALPSAYCIQPTTLLSAYSVQPAARYACSPRPGAQAPSDSIPPYASHPPFATHRASLHAWFLTQLHAMRPGSAQFSTQRPERLRHPAHRTPSALNIRPTAPQAPAASGSPFATQRASLHTWFPTQLCAMQPSSAQFPAYRPHGRGLPNAPPLAPAVSHTAPRAFAAC